ncbi:hypothetical protein [Paraburkholderia sp. GAS199]|uniref:hypothetical protein n=1 Tax=Paraburkholderia sp. GAS199 TaxID=3035126 RepID=UPI003D208E0A
MSFRECAARSWGSAWSILARMPFFLIFYVAALACTFALPHLLPGMTSTDNLADTMPASAPALSAMNLVRVVINSLLAIKIHRMVLLGEGETPLFPTQGRALLRYFGLYLLIGVVTLMLGLLAILAGKLLFSARFGLPLAVIAALAVGLFLATRISLLFSALALGSRFALKAAWRDSRSHAWWIAGIMCIVTIPPMVIGVAVAVAANPLLADTQPAQRLMLTVAGQSLLSVLMSTLSATALSWLYIRFARELRGLVETASTVDVPRENGRSE